MSAFVRRPRSRTGYENSSLGIGNIIANRAATQFFVIVAVLYNKTMRGFLGNPRRVFIVVHDLVVTALAMLATLYIRFGDGQNGGLEIRFPWLAVILPCFVAYAGVFYWYFHLYMAKWR